MLELESGSNDPWAYMLTVILLSVMQGGGSAGEIAYMIFAQVGWRAGGVLFSPNRAVRLQTSESRLGGL